MVEFQDFFYLGDVSHPEFPEKCHRLILGEKISDEKRKAYTLENDGLLLSPIPDFFSGSIGFLDYSLRKFPNHFSHYISFFGIEPEYRNNGTGKKFLSDFLEYSKKEGAKTVRANIESFREDRLKNLFLDLGFKDMGFPIERKEDCFRMIYEF